MNYLNESLEHIPARDLFKKIKQEKLIIIDIREPHELLESSIPSAVNIPMYSLLNNINSLLRKDKTYYILCHTGQRSYYVTKVLLDFSYKAINVFGGIALMPEYYHD